MEVFELGVSALAENGLRPGADLSLARAELIASVPNPPNQPNDDESQDVISHPMVARQQAELDAARARKDVAAKSSLPKFDLLASAYFRGTGALLDGTFESGSGGSGGSAGLWPTKSNWALGVAVRFPFLEIPRFEQEKTLLDFKAKAAAARYDKAVQHLTAELARAHIRVDATRRIAENTPVELEAARAPSAGAREGTKRVWPTCSRSPRPSAF